ncbi:MAG: DUF932 domain-containing protein, partial [Chlamydiia bacterium]|nr:DUF932 domain-containing protein [Chlamydiia bacterium]
MEIIQEMPKSLTTAILPEVTETYVPVQHAALVQFLYTKLERAGYSVDKADFSSDANGNKMVGTMRLSMGSDDFGMSLGFRNSYDKSMSIGVGVGATVFVCNNGMFSADVQQLRKHTSNVGKDLNRIVNKQIDYLGEMFDKYAEDVEILKSKEIHRSTMNEIVGGM